MEAEFDTVARWTAEVAAELGERYLLPAACRGSGSPAALDWLIDELAVTAAESMLDCGAGLGGPAAYARQKAGVRPVLTDPEYGACRGSGILFGFPVVQAASDLPFRRASFDVAWSLGVLCTVADQRRLLAELRRVVSASGRLGLLVFVRTRQSLPEQPKGNNFPSAAELTLLLADSGWSVTSRRPTCGLPSAPGDWQECSDEVDAELERRHSDDPVWRTAAAQSEVIGKLLGNGDVEGTLLVARPA